MQILLPWRCILFDVKSVNFENREYHFMNVTVSKTALVQELTSWMYPTNAFPDTKAVHKTVSVGKTMGESSQLSSMFVCHT